MAKDILKYLNNEIQKYLVLAAQSTVPHDAAKAIALSDEKVKDAIVEKLKLDLNIDKIATERGDNYSLTKVIMLFSDHTNNAELVKPGIVITVNMVTKSVTSIDSSFQMLGGSSETQPFVLSFSPCEHTRQLSTSTFQRRRERVFQYLGRIGIDPVFAIAQYPDGSTDCIVETETIDTQTGLANDNISDAGYNDD